jgi:2-iminobutanoate/2-iminopropanoate deaminase
MSTRLSFPLCLGLIALTLTGCANMNMSGRAETRSVAVSGAPKASGPYSQGVVANGFLYTAGTLARDPVTNNPVEGDITVQTNRVLDNLEAILAGAGCSLKDVVKVTVYMTDLTEFPKMNEAYAKRFGDHKPARTTIQAAKLPGGATMEVEMVARLP